MLSSSSRACAGGERLVDLGVVAALDLERERRARPRARRATASPTPPAIAAWFSLMRIASKSPTRWLVPPPATTAAFSSSRSPGVVLRVSRTRARVPATARDVARGQRRHPAEALQEVQRRALGGEQRGGVALERRAPGRRSRHAPSSARGATRAAGSSAAKHALGGVEPKSTPGCLLRDPRPRARAGRDGRLRRHVAGADVLGQRAGDEVVERGVVHPFEARGCRERVRLRSPGDRAG